MEKMIEHKNIYNAEGRKNKEQIKILLTLLA
jgi:hypothetical protein